MYTAKLKDRVMESGVVRWIVEFTNGTDTFTDSFKVNKYKDLQRQVTNRLADLNYVDTFVIGGSIDTTITTENIKTQAEIDMDIWFRDWRNFSNASQLVSLGIIPDTLPAYVALKTKISNNFKPVYVTYM